MKKKTITIKESTYMKLLMLKESLNYRTWDEVLENCIKCIEKVVKT